jgi:hypothetical protein
MIEIWKDVVGYEGCYQVSNTGRVKSIVRTFVSGNNSIQKTTEKELKYCITNGYKRVTLYTSGKLKNYCIHRLVAMAFIDNPYNLNVVNHKDENRLNNNVENLEWCTYKYNTNYGTTREKISKAVIAGKECKKVKAFKDGILIGRFDSVRDAVKVLNNTKNNIYKALSGKQKVACGYSWEYDD